MGNGFFHFNIIYCCIPNKDTQKDDVNIDNSQYVNIKTNNINTQNIIEEEIQNKNDQKLISTKSKQSSGSDSFNKIKQKVGEDKCPNKDQITLKANNLLKNNLLQNNLNNSTKNSLEDNLNIKTKIILEGELFSNEKIEINKNGMKNCLRQVNDGHIIFGLKDKNNNDMKNNNDCDYYINVDKIGENINIKVPIKVFEIYINKSNKKIYTLKFLHNSLILYYKINNDLLLKMDKYYYLILGDIFLTIKVKKSQTDEEKKIYIQVEIENEKPKKYTFGQKESPIKIGRVNCNINISNPSISKLHSIVDFIDDNYCYKDCESTNGSTLLIRDDDSLDIKGKMSFKLENVSFKIKEVLDDDNYIPEENFVE